MFGHDALNNLNINNLIHNSEGKIFLADKVTNSAGYTDADYTTAANGQDLIGKSGKTNPVKWDATKGVYATDRGEGFKAYHTNATDAVKFRKGFMIRYFRGAGENFVFESFSPNEPKVVKPFMTQDEFDGVDTNEDTNGNTNGDTNGDTNGGDDSNGSMGTLTDGVIKGCTDSTAENYDATATEDDGSCEFGEDEDNTLLYGGIGVGVLALILLTRK